MSNFSAQAYVYNHEAKPAGGYRLLLPAQPVHTGTIADCVKWVMAKHDGYKTHFMTVPLEAGFIKNELHYQDIEAISQRADFPKM